MIRQFAMLTSCLVCSTQVLGQVSVELAAERWFAVSTPSFEILSQRSRANTEAQARALEAWREAAAQILSPALTVGPDPIPNYVYLFDNDDDYRQFAEGQDSAYLYSSPRSNFIALSDARSAQDLAEHHYAHFLINNRPIGLPRWFEEGMAHYLSRVRVEDEQVTLLALAREQYELVLEVNDVLSLEEILYDNAALASPRLVQLANLKSGLFVHFLQHAHEYEGFTDRRQQLQQYLGHLQQSRAERFAYDQSFDVSLAVLENEFDRFLQLLSQTREDERSLFASMAVAEFTPEQAPRSQVTLHLGELALHAGRFELSAAYFSALMQEVDAPGRAWSGQADALRMGMGEEGDVAPEVEPLYQQAQTAQPDDYQLYLDYGQFLDTELKDCDASYSPPQREQMLQLMREQFARALALNPESPEVQLSYAQLYSLPGADWRQGVPYHERALSRLAADSFVLEQAVDYAILADRLADARRLVERMARPMHFWGEHPWISALNGKLQAAERGQRWDACADAGR